MPAPTSETPIDRVDENDRPIGTVLRGSALVEAANFRTAHVFVFDSAGRLLLQQVGADHQRSPGLWGSSVAGYLHSGESYEVGAARRLREELGLDVPLRWIGKLEMVDESSKKFVGLFGARSDHASNAEPGHIDALRWFEQSELDSAMTKCAGDFTPTFVRLFERFRGLLVDD